MFSCRTPKMYAFVCGFQRKYSKWQSCNQLAAEESRRKEKSSNFLFSSSFFSIIVDTQKNARHTNNSHFKKNFLADNFIQAFWVVTLLFFSFVRCCSCVGWRLWCEFLRRQIYWRKLDLCVGCGSSSSTFTYLIYQATFAENLISQTLIKGQKAHSEFTYDWVHDRNKKFVREKLNVNRNRKARQRKRKVVWWGVTMVMAMTTSTQQWVRHWTCKWNFTQ